MAIKKYESADQLGEETQGALRVKEAGILGKLDVQNEGQMVSIQYVHEWYPHAQPIAPKGPCPEYQIWNRHDLVAFARHVLREFEPTPEQEILETLRRIENRIALSGTE